MIPNSFEEKKEMERLPMISNEPEVVPVVPVRRVFVYVDTENSVYSQYICHLLTLQIKKYAKHPYFSNQERK